MKGPRDEHECHLELMDGSRGRERLSVAGGTTIGRGTDNDIQLSDVLVSRHHARIHALPDGGLELVDLGSTNGTSVNGRAIRRVVLSEGALVVIGHTRLRFDRGDAGALAGSPSSEDEDEAAVGSDEGAEPTAATGITGRLQGRRPSPALAADDEAVDEGSEECADDLLVDELMSYRALRLRRIRGVLVDEHQRARLDGLHQLLTACDVDDRRLYLRFECSLSGRLACVDGEAVPCEVVDIAVEGARVRMADGAEVSPDAVVGLTIHRNASGSHQVPVRARWSGAGELGLVFVGEAQRHAGAYDEPEPDQERGHALARISLRRGDEEARR